MLPIIDLLFLKFLVLVPDPEDVVPSDNLDIAVVGSSPLNNNG